MIKRMFNQYPVLRQIILYGVIGVFSSGIDGVCFIGMNYYSLNKYIANFISITIGICISFLLNTYINFRVTNKVGKRAMSFFTIGYMGMLLSMLILYIGCDILNFSTVIIKIISVFIVATFQFILNKLITYKKGN